MISTNVIRKPAFPIMDEIQTPLGLKPISEMEDKGATIVWVHERDCSGREVPHDCQNRGEEEKG